MSTFIKVMFFPEFLGVFCRIIYCSLFVKFDTSLYEVSWTLFCGIKRCRIVLTFSYVKTANF